MSFQFVHVETYSAKEGVGVAAEAGRKPSHSRHIDSPQNPVLLAGVDPIDAIAEIARRQDAAKDTVVVKGVTRERRMRSDAQVMLAAVASYPTPTEDLDPTDQDFIDWKRRALEFFESEHGAPLSAVLHLDESHPHIHFITAPDLERGQRMPDIHRGLRDKAAAGGNRGSKARTDRAYNEAMREYQDNYQKTVGRWHAQARLGPKVQRLTRAEWQARQAEAQRHAERLNLGRGIKRRVTLLEQREQILGSKVAKVAAKEKEIAGRERSVESIWDKLTAVVTLGRAGASRSVKDAQAAARAEKDALEKALEISKQKTLEAKARLSRRIEQDAVSARNLNAELAEAKSQVHDMTKDTAALGQLQARLRIAAEALERGDIARVQQILTGNGQNRLER